MNRPISPVSFDVHRDAIDGPTPDPWGYSRPDRLDGLGTPLRPPVVRPVAHRRATHRRAPINWAGVAAGVVLVAVVALMSGIVAVVALGLVGGW